jgi:Ca2+-binding EF-hand superfamily protein
VLSQKQCFVNDYAEAVLFQTCGVSHRMGVVLKIPQKKKKKNRASRRQNMSTPAETTQDGVSAQGVFLRYDMEGLQRIQTEYLGEVLDELQCPMSADQLHELTQHLDTNGSGYISMHEFVQWWQSA